MLNSSIELGGQSWSPANLCAVPFFRLYDTYSFQMIPVLGEVIAGDWKSYQYLVESIRKFPDQVRTVASVISVSSFLSVLLTIHFNSELFGIIFFIPLWVSQIWFYSFLPHCIPIEIWCFLLVTFFLCWDVFNRHVGFFTFTNVLELILLLGQQLPTNWSVVSIVFSNNWFNV